MTDSQFQQFTGTQLATLRLAMQAGAKQATTALAKWIEKPSLVELDSLEQLSLEEATGMLPLGQEPICFCAMEVDGLLRGEMIFAFDDASGLALAEIMMEQSTGNGAEWTEMAISVALETANIVCCAYLNALSSHLNNAASQTGLLPGPPKFNREFAESLMQFALMSQATEFDEVLLAKTRFQIDGVPVHWILLFVPDAESTKRLAELLDQTGAHRGNIGFDG